MSDDINVLVSIGKQGGNKLNLTYGQFKYNFLDKTYGIYILDQIPNQSNFCEC